ncbi:MAG: beta-glucosidase BglX [Bacteroidales bacterium]|nr:beta-glucosidase BglX [Bacteroidales bacterium]
MKKSIIMAAALCITATACQKNSGSGDAEMDAFISELMSKMTLEEKLGQLNLVAGGDITTGDALNSPIGAAVANGSLGGTFNIKGAEKIRELQQLAVDSTRLGIPLLIGMDVIHGYETIFPIPLALSCSWDMDAIETSARIAAKEASAAGINWTFSPMVDISREPRWGRMAEGSGEDPYLGSQIAGAMVRGYQGDLTSPENILACVKHFAFYGAPDGGRDYNTVDMSRNRMYNEYFAPYKAAVDAGAATVMTSFNTVDGIPATANKWLVTDVLRDRWGFDGLVVTDYGSIAEMEPHGVAKLADASAMALNAGTDMDMCSFGFINTLKQSLEEGKVTQKAIDEAVRRVLEAKYRLGLFDDPYKYSDTSLEKTNIYTPENRAEARRIAAETFVLLKNDNNTLPLERKGRIALVGPMADNALNMQGTWAVTADHTKYKSLRQGLEDALGSNGTVLYAKGANFYSDPALEAGVSPGGSTRDPRSDAELLAEARRVAAGADVIVAALGEAAESSGESSSRTDLTLPANQQALLDAMLATGKPVVMLNFSGRPTVLTAEAAKVPALMNVWSPGSEGADAIADVLFGDVNPSGRLTATLPANMGQIPIYYNHLNTGRPEDPANPNFQRYRSNYIDSPNEPLYPFGYGLSYTDFDYSNLRLSAPSLNADGSIDATVTVRNTGSRKGTETVQFYIRDHFASISRPVKELKHFERITLEPGESADVTFTITPEALSFYNSNLEFVAEPGDFSVMAGPDSERVLSADFALK